MFKRRALANDHRLNHSRHVDTNFIVHPARGLQVARSDTYLALASECASARLSYTKQNFRHTHTIHRSRSRSNTAAV